MEKISATIITRNEQHNIERCLNSLIGIADEIIVVDSFSTDATIDICRRYNCRITRREFTGYGTQRQYAAGLTNYSYILSIDADEVLSEELRQAIMALKQSGFSHRMYSADIINYICNTPVRRCGMAPVRQVRLFDKRYAIWDLSDIEERLTYSSAIQPEPLPGCIHHYRCHSYEELRFKELRNAEMRGRVLAARHNRIAAYTPLMRAAAEFLKCHLLQGAVLDGHTGHIIARERYRATLTAFSTARKIKKEQN